MTAAESAELVELAAGERPGQRRRTSTSASTRSTSTPASSSPTAALGDVRLVTGRYFQDWLLLESDWNWRLQPDQGGALRAVGDIGSHWLDLMTFVTGQPIVGGHGRPGDVHRSTRREPTGPVETFSTDRSRETRSSARSRPRTPRRSSCGSTNGARGAVSISQISAGRKNSLAVGDRRVRRRLVVGLGAARPALARPPRAAERDPPPQPGADGRRRPGRGRAAGRPRRGLRRHVRRPLPSRLRGRRGRRARPPGRRYPTFADGHDEMLVGDAIAESAREGRWVDVDRSAAAPRRASGGARDEARPADRPVPRDAARWTSSTGRPRNGFESIEIACWPRSTGPTRRYAGTSPHRRREPVGRARPTEIVDEIAAQGPVDLRARLLPEPAPSRSGPSRRRSSATSSTSSRPPRRWTCRCQHVHGRATAPRHQDAELGGGAPGLAGHRRVRPGPRPEDHHRELPDALQLRRVAGRPQPRDDAADLAPDPRAVGRHDRAQLRPVAPDPPDDRHPAVHPRVRAAHPPRPGQGPHDRSRGPVRARRLLGRDRLAGPAAARASATSTGARSSARCGAPATTATSSSSTRTATSRRPTSSSSAASCSPATSSGRTSSEAR